MGKIKTYRLFSLVCYETNIDNIMYNIVEYDLKYFYIEHQPESDEKKKHYHICVYCDNATTINKISECLEIEPNYINVSDDNGKRYNLKSTVSYFLHYGLKNKISYNVDDIQGNMIDTVLKYYDIITGGYGESNQLQDIATYIIDNDIKYMTQVVKYCLDNNLLKTLKKYQYIINILVREN